MSYLYRVYGLNIESEINIPELSKLDNDSNIDARINYGIVSDETLLSILPFIESSKDEIERRNLEKENTLDYQDLGVDIDE